MGSKSASILTQTQRNRIREEFGDLTEEKMRRDQQRIRERVRSGILDFQLLADYPDRQFGLAFDDMSEDELRTALADTHLVVERLREYHGIDRERLIEEAQDYTEEYTDATEEIGTLERIDLRTAADVRRQTEEKLTERYRPGRWDKRASGLMKLGVSASILILVIQLLNITVAGNGIILHLPSWGLIFLLLISAIGWSFIRTAQSLKYNIFPAAVKLIRSPEAVAEEMFVKLVRNPGETIQKSWDDL